MIKQKKLKHNKLKNTGLIFELLTRQLAVDALNNKKESPARDIIIKFFRDNTEINKEYSIYETIINTRTKNPGYANNIINEALNYVSHIDLKKLKSEKYNLIKEIANHYPIKTFFKNNIPNYKYYATIFKLITLREEKNIIPQCGEVSMLMESLLQYTTKASPNIPMSPKTDDEKITNSLAYKVMVKKFNEKYKNLSEQQKELIKLYFYNNSGTMSMRKKISNLLTNSKNIITENLERIDNPAVRVKLSYIAKYINSFNKSINRGKVINPKTLSNVMLFDELANAVKKI